MTVQELILVAFMKAQVEGENDTDGQMYAWKFIKDNLSAETLERIAETEFKEGINKLFEKQMKDAINMV